MPKPIKRGNRYITNIDMPCQGIACGEALPHNHRKRLSFKTKEEHDIEAAKLLLMRRQLKYGAIKGELLWQTFKIRFMVYSGGKNKQTHYRDKLAIRYLEYYYPITYLKQVTPDLLTALKQKLLDDGKRAWNINRILTALKAMMRYAEASKLLDAQVWRLARPMPTPKGRLKFWTIDETKALYGVCRGKWLTVAMLAIEAGLRREEIQTLKVSNVDFKMNRIHIVGDETWIPKDFERRWIPMKQTLRNHLLKVFKDGRIYAIGDARLKLGGMTNYFRRLVKDAGLTGSLHTGRHTYGSHLAMQGIPEGVIQKRMGHASIRTTEIYTHLCPDKTQELYAA